MKAALRLAIGLVLVAPQVASAQPPSSAAVERQPVILVVDISGSMSEDDGSGTRKIDGAKLALLDYIGNIEGGSLVGLRTYPDQAGSDCNSGKRVINIGPVNPQDMSAQIRGLQPDGDTPTAEAMRAAAKDLKDEGYARGTLVVVSDGESTCDDPCKAAREIADSGINGAAGFDLDAVTVGFRISDEGRKQLQCISDALNGRYLDIKESDELRDALDRLGRPRMEVRLDSSANPEADAGGDQIEVSATITNTGEFEARDVIGQLNFGSAAIDVLQPISRLGNLAPQESRTVKWRVRAPISAANKSFDFSVVGRAANATVAGEAQGKLKVVGVTEAAQAGEILKGPGSDIVILGDSYSAGEGADDYDDPTDTDFNGCHRSQRTYLIPTFGRQTQLYACSGAVSAQVIGPNDGDRGRDGVVAAAQTERLTKLQPPAGKTTVRAAVLTIGGNDADFPVLAKSCILAPQSCAERVYRGAPGNLVTNHIARKDFDKDHLGDSSPLAGDLERTYAAINASLNANDIVARRNGAVAPILVLAYPLPIPITGRTCAQMGSFTVRNGPSGTPFSFFAGEKTEYLVNDKELDSVFDYGTRLNAIVESAVRTSRMGGVPVFYVPATEFAFLPSHTVCDSGPAGSATEPFARSLLSFNGGALNGDTLSGLTSGKVSDALKAAGTVAARGAQELVHPNKAGYAAVTSAILRWSRTKDARNAVAFLKTAKPVDTQLPDWIFSDVALGGGGGVLPILQGGTSYPFRSGGFAPNSPTRIEMRSTPRLLAVEQADRNGLLATRIAIPRDVENGRHTLIVSGVDGQGRPHVVRVAFEVDRPFRPTLIGSIAGLSGIALLLGAILTLAGGGAGRRRSRLRQRETHPRSNRG